MASTTSLSQQSLETQLRQTIHTNLKPVMTTVLGAIGTVLVVGAVVVGVGLLSYALTKVALEP